MINLLGQLFSTGNLGDYQYLEGVINFLNDAAIPVTITLLAGAAVFAVCIAFAIMKADNAEKSDEMKKRLIGLIVTVIIIVAMVWILGFVLSNFNVIMSTIRSMGSGLGPSKGSNFVTAI